MFWNIFLVKDCGKWLHTRLHARNYVGLRWQILRVSQHWMWSDCWISRCRNFFLYWFKNHSVNNLMHCMYDSFELTLMASKKSFSLRTVPMLGGCSFTSRAFWPSTFFAFRDVSSLLCAILFCSLLFVVIYLFSEFSFNFSVVWMREGWLIVNALPILVSFSRQSVYRDAEGFSTAHAQPRITPCSKLAYFLLSVGCPWKFFFF